MAAWPPASQAFHLRFRTATWAAKTDWNGNNTTGPTTAAASRPQIIYASATTNAQTTNITYDLSWPHLPHTVATQGLTENFTYYFERQSADRHDGPTIGHAIEHARNGPIPTTAPASF